ncbi:YigZ family protein [Nisaea sp.]|uniref:YigZ family protein n=1 Tax=Nisaea sp. TaxID=2024842 RepID=UPI002B26D963|nr:YigZ family protein [Nisaea sp.]
MPTLQYRIGHQALLSADAPSKNDDGEAGAGVILWTLERERLHEHIIVVMRWFDSKHLGGARFRHVQNAVRIYLDDLRAT